MSYIKRVFTSIDLELNQNPNGAKIIQIGAVVGNLDTGEILERLSVFINPKETLEPRIIKLTKIRQTDVDGGVTLLQAYEQLKALHLKHQSFINPVVWGVGDMPELLSQLKAENPGLSVDWSFGRRTIDVKTLYVAHRIANGLQPAGGLSKALSFCKLRWKGTAHRADDDAENTFTIFKHLVCKIK